MELTTKSHIASNIRCILNLKSIKKFIKWLFLYDLLICRIRFKAKNKTYIVEVVVVFYVYSKRDKIYKKYFLFLKYRYGYVNIHQ